ncbi:MAG TPA: hypothetical protein VMT37_09960 [Solirubrobacterales bacterium]|nr:hypothetical protein [Solirubrobacterales bacterium]
MRTTPPGPSELAGRSLARAAALRQTINALLGVRPPASLRPQVARLLTALERLRRLDTSAPRRGRTEDGGGGASRAVLGAELAVAEGAAAAGLAACAPLKPGSSNSRGGRASPLQRAR